MRMFDQGFEPCRFRSQDGTSEGQETVIAAALVGPAGVGDQAKLDETGDGRVEGAGAEAQRPFGPSLDFLDHGVAVAILAGQGEQDMELMWRQWQKAVWVIHASNLDVSGFDVVDGGLVGW
jgi:hypothetical protein